MKKKKFRMVAIFWILQRSAFLSCAAVFFLLDSKQIFSKQILLDVLCLLAPLIPILFHSQ